MHFLRRFRRADSILSSDANTSANPTAIASGPSDHELEKSERRFGLWETVCGWAVAVGVVLEYGPKFMAFVHGPTWEGFRDLSGGLLIAIGVAGEIIFASAAASKRDKLRDRNVLRVAELNRKAEQERLARVRIEESLVKLKASRTLNKDQVERITEKLRPFAGSPFDMYVSSDPDSVALMHQLKDAITAAGWNITPAPGPILVDEIAALITYSGVCIEIAQDYLQQLEPAAVYAREALLAEGIATCANATPGKGRNKEVIHVIVGSKPLD